MARNVYGLDLGTYDIKIFDKKKDRIWHAKNVIAMKDKKYIFYLSWQLHSWHAICGLFSYQKS